MDEHMPGDADHYAELWDTIAEEYRALGPELSRLRPPGSNYLQIDAGGKAAHYEWKILHGPETSC